MKYKDRQVANFVLDCESQQAIKHSAGRAATLHIGLATPRKDRLTIGRREGTGNQSTKG